MTGNEYQGLSMRTNDGKSTNRLLNRSSTNAVIDYGGILNGCLGLSGEVGEFNDMIKKWIFHEKDINIEHAKKELGDVMWYVAMICHSAGWHLNEILEMNVSKLNARYPDGFDVQKSEHRSAEDV